MVLKNALSTLTHYLSPPAVPGINMSAYHAAYDSDLPISNEIGRIAAPQSIGEVPVVPLGEKRETTTLSQGILPLGIGKNTKRVTSDPTEVVSRLNRAELSRTARRKGTVTLEPFKIALPGKVRSKRVMRLSTLPKASMPAVKRVPTSLKTAMKPTTMEARLNDPALQPDTV